MKVETTKTIYKCLPLLLAVVMMLPMPGVPALAEITEQEADAQKTASENLEDGSGEEESACTEHHWDSGVIRKTPTCTQKGVKTFTCIICGETKTEETEAAGHKYETITTKATVSKKRQHSKKMCCLW